MAIRSWTPVGGNAAETFDATAGQTVFSLARGVANVGFAEVVWNEHHKSADDEKWWVEAPLLPSEGDIEYQLPYAPVTKITVIADYTFGPNFEVITTGEPTDTQVLVDMATGLLTFSAGNAGRRVQVEWATEFTYTITDGGATLTLTGSAPVKLHDTIQVVYTKDWHRLNAAINGGTVGAETWTALNDGDKLQMPTGTILLDAPLAALGKEIKSSVGSIDLYDNVLRTCYFKDGADAIVISKSITIAGSGGQNAYENGQAETILSRGQSRAYDSCKAFQSLRFGADLNRQILFVLSDHSKHPKFEQFSANTFENCIAGYSPSFDVFDCRFTNMLSGIAAYAIEDRAAYPNLGRNGAVKFFNPRKSVIDSCYMDHWWMHTAVSELTFKDCTIDIVADPYTYGRWDSYWGEWGEQFPFSGGFITFATPLFDYFATPDSQGNYIQFSPCQYNRNIVFTNCLFKTPVVDGLPVLTTGTPTIRPFVLDGGTCEAFQVIGCTFEHVAYAWDALPIFNLLVDPQFWSAPPEQATNIVFANNVVDSRPLPCACAIALVSVDYSSWGGPAGTPIENTTYVGNTIKGEGLGNLPSELLYDWDGINAPIIDTYIGNNNYVDSKLKGLSVDGSFATYVGSIAYRTRFYNNVYPLGSTAGDEIVDFGDKTHIIANAGQATPHAVTKNKGKLAVGPRRSLRSNKQNMFIIKQ